MSVLHVVLFRFCEAVGAEQRAQLLDMLASLGEACGGRTAGILEWAVGPNLDQRKGYSLIEVGLFQDVDALNRFKAHPLHQATAAQISGYADWVVGDLVVAPGEADRLI